MKLNDIEQPARQAAAHPWVEKLARLGHAAKGTVYFIVGLLAAQAAFGVGGKTTDSSGALEEIINQPFGKFLLGIVTVGLIGYALWRLVEAIFEPEKSSQDGNAKRIAKRLGYAFSAFAYGGLAATAIKLIMGSGGSGGDSTKDWTARFLAQPFGQWMVGLAGVVTIGVAIAYLLEAIKGKFRRHLKWHQMSNTERTWAMRVGRLGIISRAVVFSIIGIFLIQAARHSDPNQAKGLGEALATLAQQPFGPWILGVVALGLMAYAIYSLFEARYRRIAV
jgi:hypothetical protein